MKTFRQFQYDLKEFAPALAPLAPYVLPAAAAAIGAAGMYLSRKRNPPQPSPDYGQGETAKPRTPNVQRPSGKTTAARTQSQVARDDRKAEARARAQERVQQGIDDLIGSDAERAAAARARANPQAGQAAARKRTISQRMEKGAQNIPPEHRAD